jgi:hypothetical protein
MDVRANQVNGFLPFLSHDHHSDLSHFLDLANKPSNGKSFGLPINEERDVPIGGSQRNQRGHLRLFPIDPEDRVGFELGDHMIATPSTDLNQCFGPVPTVGQDIELTGKRKEKVLDHPLGQRNLGLKIPTTPGPFRMIESRPEREEKLFIQ